MESLNHWMGIGIEHRNRSVHETLEAPGLWEGWRESLTNPGIIPGRSVPVGNSIRIPYPLSTVILEHGMEGLLPNLF